MKRKNLHIKDFLFPAAVFLYAAICCFSTTLSSDDYVMNYAFEIPGQYAYAFTNGRYIANNLAYLIIRYPVVKAVLYTLTLFLLIMLIARFVQFKEKRPAVSWLAFGLFLTMPASIVRETVKWLFGYAVHVIPLIFTLLYMRLCFRAFRGEKLQQQALTPLCGILGLAGALFAEHISILHVVFGIFVLLYSACRKDQKPRAFQIAFAAGAAIGLFILLYRPEYKAVMQEAEELTFRTISFDLSDMYYHLYKMVIPIFAREFCLLHLCIAGAMLLLYSRTDRSSWDKKQSRYGRLALGCTVSYAVYSVMMTAGIPLKSLSSAERISALETAFVFLYMLSVIYLAFLLTDRQRMLRVTVYICSAVICALPFIVVGPVTNRCFFAGFCFWLLLALELVYYASAFFPKAFDTIAERAAAVMAGTVLCILSYIHLSNHYVFRFSIHLLREQIASGERNIVVTELPYPEYTMADEIGLYIKAISHQSDTELIQQMQEGEMIDSYASMFIEYWGLTDIYTSDIYNVTTMQYYSYTL
ncbi:MAG: hypothetical protein MJ065_07625 [Oscillospiraceae bacterium]|nr:hypothetical protein [Oscillospiraceae bacterium]